MRQTYYYNDQETPDRAGPAVEAPPAPDVDRAPAEPSSRGRRESPPPKEHGERGATIFLVVLVLLLAGTAALVALRWPTADIVLPSFSFGGRGEIVLPQTTESVHTPLQSAPTGDGTVLEVAPVPEGEAKSLQTIYQEVNPAIVSISAAVSRGYAQGVAQGTGVVMTGSGYIITNQHVIDGAFRVDVSLDDGRQMEAKLVGADEATDLAVLKVEARDLPAAVFGSSEDMAVGDTVVAIGNPMGEELRGTMTDGILSAINRDMEVDGNTMTLLQTTAALNSGNSGGALVNDRGQVIGITNMKLVSTNFGNTVEGLGFAIPTTTVKAVVDDLIAYGHVTGRPALGVTVQPLTPDERAERGVDKGLWVKAVADGSDAYGKLEEGDVLLTANGVALRTNQDLLEVRDGLDIGGTLVFQVDRAGEAMEVTVKIVEQYQLNEG